MFVVFLFFVILASLFVLWLWRVDSRMLSWKKVVLSSGICSIVLFPLGLVFCTDGVCFREWGSAMPAVVQYVVFLAALVPVYAGIELHRVVRSRECDSMEGVAEMGSYGCNHSYDGCGMVALGHSMFL